MQEPLMRNEELKTEQLASIFFRYFNVILSLFLIGAGAILFSILALPTEYQASANLSLYGYVHKGFRNFQDDIVNNVIRDPKFLKPSAEELNLTPSQMRAAMSVDADIESGVIGLILESPQKSLLKNKFPQIAERFANRFEKSLVEWCNLRIEIEEKKKKQFRDIFTGDAGGRETLKDQEKLNSIRDEKYFLSNKLTSFQRKLWDAQAEQEKIRSGAEEAELFLRSGVLKGPLKGSGDLGHINSSTKKAIEKKVFIDLARKVSKSRVEEKENSKLVAFYQREIPRLKGELALLEKEEDQFETTATLLRKRFEILEEKMNIFETNIFHFRALQKVKADFNPAIAFNISPVQTNKWAAGAGMAVLLLMAIIFLVYFWELLLKPRWSGKR